MIWLMDVTGLWMVNENCLGNDAIQNFGYDGLNWWKWWLWWLVNGLSISIWNSHFISMFHMFWWLWHGERDADYECGDELVVPIFFEVTCELALSGPFSRSTQDRHQTIQVFWGVPNPKLEPQPAISDGNRVAHGCPKNHEGYSTFDRRNDPPWELKRSLEALETLKMIKHQIGSRGLEVPSSFQIENRIYIYIL